MTKYKCPDCGNKTMVKVVYTEEHCPCGHIDHTPHQKRTAENPGHEESV